MLNLYNLRITTKPCAQSLHTLGAKNILVTWYPTGTQVHSTIVDEGKYKITH